MARKAARNGQDQRASVFPTLDQYQAAIRLHHTLGVLFNERLTLQKMTKKRLTKRIASRIVNIVKGIKLNGGQKMGQVYGYVRISTSSQDGSRQVGEILDYCKAHRLGDAVIVQETESGTTAEKPELERLIAMLKPGDTLAVWELSRLSRSSVSALFAIADRIRKAGAALLETKSGTMIGNDVAGEAYLFALGLASRIERDLISDRTKSALAARKAKGVKLGRPAGKSRLDARKPEIEKYQAMGLPKASIAKLLGCSRSAYLNWLASNKPL